MTESKAWTRKKNVNLALAALAAAKKRHEHHVAGVKAILASVSPEERERVRALPRHEKQKIVTDFMMRGLSMRQCAAAFGITEQSISLWFRDETSEMQKLMRAALGKEALQSVPMLWRKLVELTESINAETGRKAILDCLRAAGLAVDPGAAGQTLNINAQNLQLNQYNNLPIQKLDQEIMALAGRLGPDAMKIAQSEVKGEPRDAGTSPAPVPAAAESDRGTTPRKVPRSSGGAPTP